MLYPFFVLKGNQYIIECVCVYKQLVSSLLTYFKSMKFKYLVLLICTVFVNYCFAQQDSLVKWHLVKDWALFFERDGSGILEYNGKMWLFGGWNGRVLTSGVGQQVWNTEDGEN